MTNLNYLRILIIFILLIILWIINININHIHPIYIITIIIIYRIVICILLSKHSYNYIFSIILFLIIIRGLLIIFLYFARLISNNQTKFKINIFTIIRILINFIIINILTKKLLNYLWYYSIEINSITYINLPLFQNIFKIYYYPFNNITLICIFYLLITLISIIKICIIKSSSLRKLI